MKRIFLYVFVVSSGAGLMGCDFKDNVQPPKAARSMSIAGMPVYEKDFKLQPLLANNIEVKETSH
ncbi:hypothetical protein IAE19_11135 [Acinetobacter sp. S40]|uniref:NF038215 family lipoprotein n=1 Tax=unclassified Acinetobacter TaxID=196816 RepID=UPI00190BEC73|nr:MULTISPECIES: NF038215 family lipoprotein [unclassified Acinetobacter]MBJ9985988.1 hypothetical protein [Acinetobacter sp. S40]MBK0064492.1 hypothetical protein [Acinetobacter sp. S55]MBK0067190.1 hypothetical protein [Acinetobacter sp. S54]